MRFGSLGLGLLVRSLTQLAVLIASSWYFSPEDIGIAALTFATYHLIWTMFEIAAGQSLLQLDADEKDGLRALTTLLLGSVIVCLLVIAIFLPVLRSMDPETGGIVAALIAALVLIRATGTFSSYAMLRELRIKRYALIEHGSYVAGMVAALILSIALDLGTLYLLLGLLFYSVISATAFIWSSPVFVRPAMRTDMLVRLGRLASGFWIASGLNTFVREANIIFIGVLLSTEATAQYSRAFQLYMLGNFTVGQLFDRLLTPIFRKQRHDGARNAQLFEVSSVVLLVLFIPASCLLMLEASAVIPLLFGAGWDAAVPALQVLCIGMTFRTAMKINESVLRASGYVYTRVGYYLIWSAVLCLGAAIVYPRGLIGFAIVEVIGAGLFWVLSLRTTTRLIGASTMRLVLPFIVGLLLSAVFAGLHMGLASVPTVPRLMLEFLGLLAGAGLATALVISKQFGTLGVLRQLR